MTWEDIHKIWKRFQLLLLFGLFWTPFNLERIRPNSYLTWTVLQVKINLMKKFIYPVYWKFIKTVRLRWIETRHSYLLTQSTRHDVPEKRLTQRTLVSRCQIETFPFSQRKGPLLIQRLLWEFDPPHNIRSCVRDLWKSWLLEVEE